MLSRLLRSRRVGALISRADRARAGGRWSTAARFYRKSLAAFPANPAIWIQYGHALKESGRPAEAEAAYRAAIGYDPSSAEARLQLGHVLKIQARRDEAEACYLLAAALDPAAPEPRRELKGLGWSEPEIAGLQQPSLDRTACAAERELLRSAFDRRRDSLCEMAEKTRRSEAGAAEMHRRIADLQAELQLTLSGPEISAAGMAAKTE